MIRLAPAKDGIDISLVRTDGGTQSRATLQHSVIDEYAAAIGEGASFPPIVVFYDGTDHWLADGFHRYQAHLKLGLAEIETDIHQGTRRDAILYSVGANEAHGLRRTNEDKRRAVLTLVNDAEWVKWSDREIARRCNVSDKTVASLRPVTADFRSKRTYTTKHGTQATMNTSNIGGTKTTEEDMESVAEVETPKTTSPHAMRIKVPDGMTVENLVRKGMAIEEAGSTAEEVAASLGIGVRTFRQVKDIIYLSEHSGLTERHSIDVQRAMALVNDTHRIGDAWVIAEPICQLVWGKGFDASPRAVREAKRLERFEHAFGIIMHGCTTAPEIDLPYLSAQRAKKAISEINAARRHLADLLQNIKEIHG